MRYIESKLFLGIAPDELNAMLGCLRARVDRYKKGNIILDIGTHTDSVALVLEGNVNILQDDYWGNRNIISVLGPGDVFAEAFAVLPDAVLNISAVAENDCEIMFLSVARILTTCSNSCAFHTRMSRNLFVILAEKNRKLNEKLTHISQRSTREKVLSFLSAQAREHRSDVFTIPMDRQQLADYLSVDRSALSTELSKLKKDGLIDYRKSVFRVFEKRRES